MKDSVDKNEAKRIELFLETICNHWFDKITEIETRKEFMDYILDDRIIQKYSEIKRDILRCKWEEDWKKMFEVASGTHQQRARKERKYESVIEVTQAFLDDTIMDLIEKFLEDYNKYIIN